MAIPLSPIEKLQRGIPLNPELDALRTGKEPEPKPRNVIAFDPAWEYEQTRDISRKDREDLKEITERPGWKVLQRLHKKTIESAKESTINLSQQDPLGNADKVANGWAYVIELQNAVASMNQQVAYQIALLEKKETS